VKIDIFTILSFLIQVKSLTRHWFKSLLWPSIEVYSFIHIDPAHCLLSLSPDILWVLSHSIWDSVFQNQTFNLLSQRYLALMSLSGVQVTPESFLNLTPSLNTPQTYWLLVLLLPSACPAKLQSKLIASAFIVLCLLSSSSKPFFIQQHPIQKVNSSHQSHWLCVALRYNATSVAMPGSLKWYSPSLSLQTYIPLLSFSFMTSKPHWTHFSSSNDQL
jgi:hypothetical protein